MPSEAGAAPVRCVAGAGAAPPKDADGPSAYRSLITAQNWAAESSAGAGGHFSVGECNRLLSAAFQDGFSAERSSGNGQILDFDSE
jgi:hypothetical protein